METASYLILALLAASPLAACAADGSTPVSDADVTGKAFCGTPGTYCHDANTLENCGGGIAWLYDCGNFCSRRGGYSYGCASGHLPGSDWDVVCICRDEAPDGAPAGQGGDPGDAGADRPRLSTAPCD